MSATPTMESETEAIREAMAHRPEAAGAVAGGLLVTGGLDVVNQTKRALQEALLQDNDEGLKESMRTLLRISCPWNVKYTNQVFADMIKQNCNGENWADRLMACMEVLEKIGRVLLKSHEARDSDWRNISYKSEKFRTKVEPVKKSRRVLHLLGYTLPTHMGCTFDNKPDVAIVAPLVVEIFMVHHELLAYICGTHPHPEIIETLLPPERRKYPSVVSPDAQTGHHLQSPSEPEDTFEPLEECEICGKPPEWFCSYCEGKRLCDGCDRSWHRHQRRKNHNRDPLFLNEDPPLEQRPPTAQPQPANEDLPPPVPETIRPQIKAIKPTASAYLPAGLDSVKTQDSEEDMKERSELVKEEISQNTEKEDLSQEEREQIPSNVPLLSVFLPEKGEGSGKPSLLLPSSIVGSTAGSYYSQVTVARKKRRTELEEEEKKLAEKVADIDQKVNQLIRSNPSFYSDASYRSLRKERLELVELRVGVLAKLQDLDEEATYDKPQKDEDDSRDWKVTTPPVTTYQPPWVKVQQPAIVAASMVKNCPYCKVTIGSKELACAACQATPQQPTSELHISLSPMSIPQLKLRWECKRCTLQNEPSATKRCSICNSVMPENPRLFNLDGSLYEPTSSGASVVSPQSPKDRRVIASVLDEEKIVGACAAPPSVALAGKDRNGGLGSSQTTGRGLARRSQSAVVNKMSPMTSPSSHLPESHSMGSLHQSNLEDAAALRSHEIGKALVSQLRNAENNNFSPAEFEFAYSQEPINTLPWLQNTWAPLLDEFTARMSQLKNPSLLISRTEARDALLAAKGAIQTAAQNCIHNRLEMVDELKRRGLEDETLAHTLLQQTEGSVKESLALYNQRNIECYIQRLWDKPCIRALRDPKFTEQLADTSIDYERRVRLVQAECSLSWGRAENVLRILSRSHGEGQAEGEDWSCVDLEDIVETVRAAGDFRTAVARLQYECSVCFGKVPHCKLKSLVCCECQVCEQCLCQHFEVRVREHHIWNWICPVCSQPDIADEEKRNEHFLWMELLLKKVVKQDVYELFEKKLRDWSLMNDPKFRWCSHCDFGFIFDERTLKMECPKCKKHTCFECKKPWESQHEGLTCEQFQAWKQANDPELQSLGLAKILAENGIDCPACKFRYALAKGGCMHFKCTQCQHEFCSGCHRPFKRGETCGKYDTCRQGGLHCHHPRDCLFYMRDYDVDRLQELLQNHDIEFNKDVPGSKGAADTTCPVMEQKEQPDRLVDEPCARQVKDKHAGLCEIHYKEYLVSLINQWRIDPVEIMTDDALVRLLEKNNIRSPPRRKKESSVDYRAKISRMVKENLPLPPPVRNNVTQIAPETVAPRNNELEGIPRIPVENGEEAVIFI